MECFPNFSLLVYRNTTDFCMLTWTVPWIHLFLFLNGSLQFLYSRPCHLQKKKKNPLYFFLFWMPFISSCLVALGRTCMVNRSDKDWYSCLALVKEKTIGYPCSLCCWLWSCHIWPLLCYNTFVLCIIC